MLIIIGISMLCGCNTAYNSAPKDPVTNTTQPTPKPTNYPTPEVDNQLYGDYSEVRPVAVPTPAGNNVKKGK